MRVYNFTSLLICNIEPHSTLVNALCRIFCENLYSVLVLDMLLTSNAQIWLLNVYKYIYFTRDIYISNGCVFYTIFGANYKFE